MIFVVAATDRDARSNGQVAFSFGLGNEDGKFSIQPYTGIISVVGTLNYRLTQYYQVGTIWNFFYLVVSMLGKGY